MHPEDRHDKGGCKHSDCDHPDLWSEEEEPEPYEEEPPFGDEPPQDDHRDEDGMQSVDCLCR